MLPTWLEIVAGVVLVMCGVVIGAAITWRYGYDLIESEVQADLKAQAEGLS